MKKLFLFVAIAISIASYSQAKITLGAGFDVRNAVYGGTVNDKALDVQFKLLMQAEWLEIGIKYELFDYLDYQDFTISTSIYKRLGNFELSSGLEGGLIDRSGQSFLFYGLNAETRYFYKRYGIGLQLNVKDRTDIDKWVNSGYLNFYYRLN